MVVDNFYFIISIKDFVNTKAVVYHFRAKKAD